MWRKLTRSVIYRLKDGEDYFVITKKGAKYALEYNKKDKGFWLTGLADAYYEFMIDENDVEIIWFGKIKAV
ncbi:hypothetical protein [Acinetobacter sp.]|uniref:hypothetical protein n=1 Tax=Acinetobacter sp. TaxID=472 RepID=UPI003CFEF98A